MLRVKLTMATTTAYVQKRISKTQPRRRDDASVMKATTAMSAGAAATAPPPKRQRLHLTRRWQHHLKPR